MLLNFILIFNRRGEKYNRIKHLININRLISCNKKLFSTFLNLLKILSWMEFRLEIFSQVTNINENIFYLF